MTHTVGPTTLKPLVEQQPPAAVVVGVEPREFSALEKPLRQIAEPNWPTQTYAEGLEAYFHP